MSREKAQELARLVDRAALDASEGPRARHRVTVPRAWLEEGRGIEVDVPARLGCARCDGGGCDSCGRSGALRGPDDASLRRLVLRLPGGDQAVAFRLPRPFGDGVDPELLLLEVVPGDAPSADVRATATRALAPRRSHYTFAVMAMVALAAAYALWRALGG